jgi:hypothetical protein
VVQAPCNRIEAVDEDAAVEIRRATGTEVGCPILDKDAAVYGLGRFESVKGADELVGQIPETPRKRPVRGSKAMHPSIATAEEDESFVIRGWRVDAAAGEILPQFLSVAGV